MALVFARLPASARAKSSTLADTCSIFEDAPRQPALPHVLDDLDDRRLRRSWAATQSVGGLWVGC
ncbi:MAG: hypothetical protein BGO04_05865 [Microbacterium sp. 70-38]|nr:MAG: hypothetical protein BGO04_05865 [Microbacterium sp. 70-38]